ncbi:MAG TPA: MFS transporter [Caulobacteraceae bacterium]
MTGAAPADAKTGWADLFAEGRLPRFALICLGVWLNAADSLITATIMPSVGADLGGYAYFSWAIAGFLMGAILAGASAGRLSEMFGLRAATAFAGVVFAVGCLMSAAGPNIGYFLAGRLVQGIGSGWISGFSMVAVALLFPERHLARVFACVTGIWGIATVVGPLVGGVFAEAGNWRGVFWLFAVQAVLFAVAAPWLLKGSGRGESHFGVPWLQLGVLAAGVGAIAVADVYREPVVALALVAAGFAVLGLVLWIDARAPVRLMPHRAGDLRTVVGSGYAAMFAMMAATMGLSVYGPAILQETRGLSPLWAGYAVAAEALAWTTAGIAVAGATGVWPDRWVRIGTLCILVSVVMLAVTFRDASIGWIVAGASLMGAGLGLCSAFMNRRVIAALSNEDKAIGSGAIMAVRQTGSAAGAAIAGVAANLVGFSGGLTMQTAQSAAVWVFVAAIPLAVAATLASFRLTGSAERA